MNLSNASLLGALVGMGGTISNAMDADPGFVPCGHPAAVVLSNLLALDADLPSDELSERADQVAWFIGHVHEHHGAPMAAVYDASELSDAQLQLIDGLRELAALMFPALQRGASSPELNAYVYRSLAVLPQGETEIGNKLAVLDSMRAAAQQL